MGHRRQRSNNDEIDLNGQTVRSFASSFDNDGQRDFEQFAAIGDELYFEAAGRILRFKVSQAKARIWAKRIG